MEDREGEKEKKERLKVRGYGKKWQEKNKEGEREEGRDASREGREVQRQ